MNLLSSPRTFLAHALPMLCLISHAAAADALSEEQKKAITDAVDAGVKKANVGLGDILSNMSVGIIVSRDFGNKDARVESAQVVNGVVRVEKSSRTAIFPVLEAHYIIPASFGDSALWDGMKTGFGQYISLGFDTNGTDEVSGPISSFHTGILYQVCMKSGSQDNSLYLNFGGGISVTPNAKVLGDGIQANQPLPAGETEVRYKYEERWGWNLMTTIGYRF